MGDNGGGHGGSKWWQGAEVPPPPPGPLTIWVDQEESEGGSSGSCQSPEPWDTDEKAAGSAFSSCPSSTSPWHWPSPSGAWGASGATCCRGSWGPKGQGLSQGQGRGQTGRPENQNLPRACLGAPSQQLGQAHCPLSMSHPSLPPLPQSASPTRPPCHPPAEQKPLWFRPQCSGLAMCW